MEDKEFLAAFDKVMLDDIQSRREENLKVWRNKRGSLSRDADACRFKYTSRNVPLHFDPTSTSLLAKGET